MARECACDTLMGHIMTMQRRGYSPPLFVYHWRRAAGILCTSLVRDVMDAFLVELKLEGFIERAQARWLASVHDNQCSAFNKATVSGDRPSMAPAIGGGGRRGSGGWGGWALSGRAITGGRRAKGAASNSGTSQAKFLGSLSDECTSAWNVLQDEREEDDALLVEDFVGVYLVLAIVIVVTVVWSCLLVGAGLSRSLSFSLSILISICISLNLSLSDSSPESPSPSPSLSFSLPLSLSLFFSRFLSFPLPLLPFSLRLSEASGEGCERKRGGRR